MNRGRFVGAFGAISGAVLLLASPAQATRSIVIDVAGQSNKLTGCSTFDGCQQLTLSGQSGAIPMIDISPNGYFEFLDFSGGRAHFSISESSTAYQLRSGYSLTTGGRIDFVNFYAAGVNVIPNSSGNLPPPDFQVTFQTLSSQHSGIKDMEIAYAYREPSDGAANILPDGAKIGYTGNIGLISEKASNGASLLFSGNPVSQSVVADRRLLLGSGATDSDFAFVIGTYPNRSFSPVPGLVSETFSLRYADAAVPEPATWAMLLLGFGVIGATQRRRNRIAARV